MGQPYPPTLTLPLKEGGNQTRDEGMGRDGAS
jgi:hypothetical protein